MKHFIYGFFFVSLLAACVELSAEESTNHDTQLSMCEANLDLALSNILDLQLLIARMGQTTSEEN